MRLTEKEILNKLQSSDDQIAPLKIPEFNRRQKEARLDEARRRLLRWFDINQ